MIKNDYIIPEDWINQKISRLDNFIGDIPELSLKISQIRTWTYISNHHSWLADPKYWQEKTLQIENNLSDHLHDGLTNKFIDSSSKYFINNNKSGILEKVEINFNNEVVLDGKIYGFVKGFGLVFNKNIISHSLFSLSHVKKSIRNMIEEKIDNFLNAPDNSINFGSITKLELSDQVYIFWGEDKIGQLVKGSKIYKPIAETLNTEFLSSEKKLLVSAKLQNWIDNQINNYLKPITEKLDDDLNPSLRAIIFNCFENLGTLEIDNFIDFTKNIEDESKRHLSRLGIRIGAKFFFIPHLMKKKSIELSAILWKIFNNNTSKELIPLPSDGRVSFISNINMPDSYWTSIGYICINNFAFRIDIFEKIFYLARKKIKYGPFLESADLMNPIGCNSQQLEDIMLFCGYETIFLIGDKKMYFFKQKTKALKKKIKKQKTKKIYKHENKQKKLNDPNSPFAVLEKLL